MAEKLDMLMAASVSVAPMMDWTDRHCRYFMRLLSPSAFLYTEMITATALRFGDADKLLEFDRIEHPVALQLGGSEPDLMAYAASRGAERGYDEININVGCPSDRVQSGAFGACLMARPETVANCVTAMRAVTDVPITVKTRIGIETPTDRFDSYEYVRDFVAAVSEAGCQKVIVHARIAILSGLSPKENRTVPSLNYDRVYRLKTDFPALAIVLNGGVTTCVQVADHLKRMDGVMIGRQAYHHPWLLAELERQFGDEADAHRRAVSRVDVVEQMYPYIERELDRGAQLKHITRHMLGLFAGQPGARAWRRYLSEHAHRPGAGPGVLREALLRLGKAARSGTH